MKLLTRIGIGACLILTAVVPIRSPLSFGQCAYRGYLLGGNLRGVSVPSFSTAEHTSGLTRSNP